METWLLKLVHLFDKMFIRQGIDIQQMYAIVETKMLMDKRRVYVTWRQDSQSENNNHLSMILGGYFLFGVLVSIIVFVVPSFMLAMIFVHAYIVFMMGMTLITDFSSILLDTTDNQIVLPKPVNGKTLMKARQIHLVLYIFQFTGALVILPLITIGVKYGILTGITFVFTTVLSVWLAIAFTWFIYLLFLRFSSEERVRHWVNRLQVLMTVMFLVGYQFMMRMTDFMKHTDSLQLKWYAYLMPPVWMAMALESVYTLQLDALHVFMIVLAASVPLLFYGWINRYLAPVFASKLSALGTDVQTIPQKKGNDRATRSISSVLSRWFTSTTVSKAVFELVWKITGRDKTFKMQVYPLIGYIIAFLTIYVLFDGMKRGVSFNEISNSTKYLWFLYSPILLMSTALRQITMNENFAAAWIYFATPVKRPGEVVIGSVHAVFVKFFLPLYLLFFFLCLLVWKQHIIDDFLFGLVNNYLFVLITTALMDKYLPFSQQPTTERQAGKTVLMLLQLIGVALFAGIHYLVSRVPVLFYFLLPAELTLCWLVRRELRNLPWNKMMNEHGYQ